MDEAHSARQQLKYLISSLRAAADPGAFPKLAHAGPRTKPGLTQDDVGIIVGVSTRYVRDLENGRARNPSTTFLESMSRALQMTPAQRVLLYRWTRGHDPYPEHTSSALPPNLRATWDAIIHATAYPAYLSGPDWSMVTANRQCLELMPAFRDHPDPNIMRYCLLDTSVRDTLLLDWFTDWARPMVAQVKSAWAVAALKAHQGMQALVNDLQTDAIIRQIWTEIPDDSRVKIHPNGDTRRISHPQYGEQRLIITASTPMGYTDHRIIILVPMAAPGRPSAVARVWGGYARAAGGASDAMRAGTVRTPRQRRRT